MAKLENILKKVFYTTLAVFPLLTGCLLGADVLYKSTRLDDYGKSVKYDHGPLYNRYTCIALSFIIIILITLVYMCFYKSIKEFFKNNSNWLPIIVLLVAVITRFVLFFVFKDRLVPFSDADNVWRIANGERDTVIFRRKLRQNGWNNFSAWAYICVQFLNFEYTTFIALQMLVDAIIALFLYLITYRAIKSIEISLMSGLIYALSPTVVLRNLFFSPDIYSLFMVVITIYILSFVCENEKFSYRERMIAFVAGIFTGIGNSIKSSAIIIVVAVAIVMFMKALRKKEIKNKLLSYLLVILIIAIPGFGINKLALWSSSIIMNYPVRDLNTLHFINVGFNPYGEGTLAEANSCNYMRWIESGEYTPEEAKGMLKDFLITSWSESGTKVVPWMWSKIKVAWRDDFHTYSKVGVTGIDRENITDGKQQFVLDFWDEYENSIQQCMYIVTMGFATIGVLIIMKKYSNSDILFICGLFVFGFALLLLLSEVQGRYKTNIMPLLYMFSSIGFYEFMELCRKLVYLKNDSKEKEKQTITV